MIGILFDKIQQDRSILHHLLPPKVQDGVPGLMKLEGRRRETGWLEDYDKKIWQFSFKLIIIAFK